jgi:pyridoxamine 5'-phosphate oxidase
MNPTEHFKQWFDHAVEQKAFMPEAVCLATVNAEGRPSARMVLFKGIDGDALTFFTNYGSRKAHQLDGQPVAALVFHWLELERQVRFEGRVERLSADKSDAYFASRGRGSRLSAWASQQSQPISDRATLELQYAEVEARFEGKEVPRPEFWGGYRLLPDRAEFWQGMPHRFHERLEYVVGDGGWTERHLQP